MELYLGFALYIVIGGLIARLFVDAVRKQAQEDTENNQPWTTKNWSTAVALGSACVLLWPAGLILGWVVYAMRKYRVTRGQ